MAVATKVWPVERYARFVVRETTLALSQDGEGTWQHFSSQDGSLMQLALLDSNHLMISNGNQILESFSLWETQNWIKAVTKGDSILFLYRLQGNDNRRFRIKLAPQSPTSSSLDTCKDVVCSLKQLLPIRYWDEGPTSGQGKDNETQTDTETDYNASQMDGEHVTSLSATSDTTTINEMTEAHEMTTISLSQTAQDLLSSKQPIGRAYADTHIPTTQLSLFIRLCLTDSNFPAFVEAVEKELNAIQSP